METFEVTLLLLQARPRGRELRGTGRLILFQLVILRLGLEEERAGADAKCGQKHDIQKRY